MASSKDIYEAKIYAANIFAAGVWRGSVLGVGTGPITIGTVTLLNQVQATVSPITQHNAELQLISQVQARVSSRST